MDTRAQERIADVGMITLINLNDRYSRVRLLIYPCWVGKQLLEHFPSTEDYQLVLRLAFAEWDLPDRIAVDHDRVFYDNKSKSPFPARIYLCLIALGVSLVFGWVGRPFDLGMT